MAVLKGLNDSMFAKLSGRLFQSWTAVYEKDQWPVDDLKNGILNLSLGMAGQECNG